MNKINNIIILFILLIVSSNSFANLVKYGTDWIDISTQIEDEQKKIIKNKVLELYDQIYNREIDRIDLSKAKEIDKLWQKEKEKLDQEWKDNESKLHKRVTETSKRLNNYEIAQMKDERKTIQSQLDEMKKQMNVLLKQQKDNKKMLKKRLSQIPFNILLLGRIECFDTDDTKLLTNILKQEMLNSAIREINGTQILTDFEDKNTNKDLKKRIIVEKGTAVIRDISKVTMSMKQIETEKTNSIYIYLIHRIEVYPFRIGLQVYAQQNIIKYK